jgi:hypothetical protein
VVSIDNILRDLPDTLAAEKRREATKNNRATPGMPGVVAFRLRDV